jgi:hypothetical protein
VLFALSWPRLLKIIPTEVKAGCPTNKDLFVGLAASRLREELSLNDGCGLYPSGLYPLNE